jgi:hypothetical protein
MFEWDASSKFDDVPTYGSVKPLASSLIGLTGVANGPLVYQITGLTTGISYWIRVSATNSIGYGQTTSAPVSVTPLRKPPSPSAVSLSTATSQAADITSTNITWTAPTGTSSETVGGYLIEYWEDGSVPEVQLCSFRATGFPTVTNGRFRIMYGPQPYISNTTSELTYLTDEYNLRSELMNLGVAANLQLIGDVKITRSLILGQGYDWTITYTSDINKGDQVISYVAIRADEEHRDGICGHCTRQGWHARTGGGSRQGE